MKKLILAVLICTLLSLPAFASFRLGFSFDAGDTEAQEIPASVHALFTFLEPIKDAIEVGVGASFWNPVNLVESLIDTDYGLSSSVAIYASGIVYPLKLILGSNAGLYVRLNLGYNFAPFSDYETTSGGYYSTTSGCDFGGGFYGGLGIGYNITDSFFVEILYAAYANTAKTYSVSSSGTRTDGEEVSDALNIFHLCIGFRFGASSNKTSTTPGASHAAPVNEGNVGGSRGRTR